MPNVAIVGGGFMGTTHAKGYKNIGVNVVAIADIDKKAMDDFVATYACKGYSSASEMLKTEGSNIDFVDICIPTSSHEEMVLLVAEHDKHILCEKPFSLTLDSVDRMLAAVNKKDKIFMIGQVLRFWREYVQIKKWVDEGIFGDIRLVSAFRLGQHPTNPWYADAKQSGGGVYDLHVHDIDFLCYLFGDVSEVYATGKKASNGCYNFVNSTLRFKNGVNATAEVAFGITDNYPFSMNLRVVGEKATAEFSFSAGFNLEDLSSAKNSLVLYQNGKEPEKQEASTRDPYEMEVEYFSNCVKDNKKAIVADPLDVRRSIEAVCAVVKSLDSGNIIKI